MIIFDQSAVIPYRKTEKGIEIMLVTTRNGNWTIPKGIIEDNLTPQLSAAKEALEEAGIEGKVKRGEIGKYTYKKWGGTCTVKVYKMKVKDIHKNWEEDNFRTRMWIQLDKTDKFIKNKELLSIINSSFNKKDKRNGK